MGPRNTREPPDDEWLHKNQDPLTIPVETWLQMTKAQRDAFIAAQREYEEELEQERRNDRKRSFGY